VRKEKYYKAGRGNLLWGPPVPCHKLTGLIVTCNCYYIPEVYTPIPQRVQNKPNTNYLRKSKNK
jgi:hypothetical protein